MLDDQGPPFFFQSSSGNGGDNGILSLNATLLDLLVSWAEIAGESAVSAAFDLPRARLRGVLREISLGGHVARRSVADVPLCLFTVQGQTSFSPGAVPVAAPPALHSTVAAVQGAFLSQLMWAFAVSPLVLRTRFAVTPSFCKSVGAADNQAWHAWSSGGLRIRARHGLFADPGRPPVPWHLLAAGALELENRAIFQ